MAYGNQNRNGKYSNRENREQIHLEKIELNYQKHEQLFGEIAKKWADKIKSESFNDRGRNNGKNKINQIRSFYEKVLELNEKSEGLSDEQYKKEVLPFVIMLKSKVAYAKSRDLVSSKFENMINQCVDEASTVEKMQNFKYFFEAIIGFYPKK